jgi:hypothetical protein
MSTPQQAAVQPVLSDWHPLAGCFWCRANNPYNRGAGIRPKGSGSNTGAIVGAVVGSIVGLLLLAAVIAGVFADKTVEANQLLSCRAVGTCLRLLARCFGSVLRLRPLLSSRLPGAPAAAAACSAGDGQAHGVQQRRWQPLQQRERHWVHCCSALTK